VDERALGDVIERHMLATGFLERPEGLLAAPAASAMTGATPVSALGPLCPKCSQPGLVREAGCLSCLHCGWSKCG
jgi:ribonucleoside-diphosphate reductase alpha chain